MARTTNQPSAATRLDTATTPPADNGSGSFDQPDKRSEDGLRDDTTARRENPTTAREGQDSGRDDSRENLDRRENQDRREVGGDSEQRSRREQAPTLSAGFDAITPVLDAWKQVFRSWSELAQTMVKVQQDAFASMIADADLAAKDITDVKVGDRRSGELAFSGARTAAPTPDRVERDRR